MNKQTITLTGLTCDACVKIIIRKFMKIMGVKVTRVMLDGTAHVEASRVIDKDEYVHSLEGLPYKVLSVDGGNV